MHLSPVAAHNGIYARFSWRCRVLGMAIKLFANLPVRSVADAQAFFTGLGFELQEAFSNEEVACLLLGDNVYALMLEEKLFAASTKYAVASRATEVALAVEVDDRARVDTIVDAAVAAGADDHDLTDDEVMYSRGFYDLDGHLWHFLAMKAG